MLYKVNDVVRCKEKSGCGGDSPVDLVGVIVEIFNDPDIAFEVEFSGPNGETTYTSTLSADDIELVNLSE